MKNLAILGLATLLFACNENDNKTADQDATALESQEAYTEENADLRNESMTENELTRVSDRTEYTYTLRNDAILPTAEGVEGSMNQMNTNLSLLEAEIQRVEAPETETVAVTLGEDAQEKIAEAREKIGEAREKIEKAHQEQAEGDFEDASEALEDANEKMAEAEEKYMDALEKETGVEIED